MLKKMRWRFIGSAMAAITAVVLALVVGMNLWNFYQTTQGQDDTLRQLADWDLSGPQEPPDKLRAHREGKGELALPDSKRELNAVHMPGPFGGNSLEFRHTLRFFSVQYDADGNLVDTDREYIASVSQEEAAAWAEQVVKSGKTRGYLNGYRYWRQATEEGVTVRFLNAEREIQAMRSLALTSTMAALLGLLVVFGLVVLFSRRAIAPYVRNIETQKRFITDASHELKTPLTAISASADVLAMDCPDSEWVASIQDQCARMTKLVGNLVALSRLDEAQPFPDRADFSLSDAVWEIAEPMATLAKAKGRVYTQDIEDGLTLHGDRAAIQQMVSILLDNALKYSDSQGRIHLRVGRNKRKTEISVFNTCDTAGMDVTRLFDRFYRPDSSRSSHTGGTGIGLSIAQATAQHHGGDISAKKEDGGITFTVRL